MSKTFSLSTPDLRLTDHTATAYAWPLGREPTPPPQPSNMLQIWGIVVDPSGVCIEGATVEVVGGPVFLGQKATQTTPCDLERFSGGFEFDEPVHADIWGEMTLRASAPGYVSQEQNLSRWPWDRILTFTLAPTGAAEGTMGARARLA